MAATLHDQLWFLVVFSVAALFLLTRLHALDEQATWVRRRIGDPSAVGAIYLRGGAVFIIVAVLGSLDADRDRALGSRWGRVVTTVEAVAQLDVSAAIQRFLPTLEDSRGIGGVQFGPTALRSAARGPPTAAWRDRRARRPATTTRTTGGPWPTTGSPTSAGSGPAATDTVTPAARSRARSSCRDARPGRAARHEGRHVPVTPNELRGKLRRQPAGAAVDRPRRDAGRRGAEAFFQVVEISATSRTRSRRGSSCGDEDGGLTQNKLRAAGQDYPPDDRPVYHELGHPTPSGPRPEQSSTTAPRSSRRNGSPRPVRPRQALVTELQSRRFTYDPDVHGMQAQCGDDRASPSASRRSSAATASTTRR